MILCIGANGFIAKHTIVKLQNQGFTTLSASRDKLNIVDSQHIEKFCKACNDTFDAVLFFQGINPSMNTKEMTSDHFSEMLSVNLTGPTMLIKHLHNKLNKNALVLFISSVATNKGSYDPSYAAAKAGMTGLINSLSNEFPDFRFNIISLGLVKDSPVYKNMTPDFRKRHADRMGGSFVKIDDVSNMISELIRNQSINREQINIHRGFKS